MKPQFPLYIVSKGRYETPLTARALESMGVEYNIVVEEQERAEYEKAVKGRVVVLDKRYQEEYETCDDLGATRSRGPGPARNFVWDHSISEGYDWHWVMDDNIWQFYRFNRNLKTPCRSASMWRAMEDFCLRYENVVMAGPQYYMFIAQKTGDKVPPYVANTRIYSCNLIRNDAPFRWRGRYNEDTDLSLRMLKAGLCTIQFNAFLQFKMPTQTVKGGNTDEFYHAEGELVEGEKYARGGTLAKSQMQVRLHPDVSKLVWRFGRVHHHVNYRPFKKNRLRRKAKLRVKKGTNNFGMELKTGVDAHMPQGAKKVKDKRKK
jgi:hypothetical protein